jgi:hypothetical protein
MISHISVIEQAEKFIQSADEYLKSEDYRKIPVITCWMDLLGFSGSLADSISKIEEDLPSNSLAAKRIALFNETAILSMNNYGTNVCLNDALVMSMDIIEYDEDKVAEFLNWISDRWEVANIADIKIGGFGVRAVISYSIRIKMRGNLGWLPGDRAYSNIKYYSPEPISMNMAFMKSYLVESSHELIKEGSIYIENNFLDKLNPVMPDTWDVLSENEITKLGIYTLVKRTYDK